MSIVIFATVGTSAIYNEGLGLMWSDRQRNKLRNEVLRYREDVLKKPESWTVLFEDVVRAHKAFWSMPEPYTRHEDNIHQTSAELVSTMSILLDASILRGRTAERIVFLASDTPEGRFAAEINAEVFRSQRKDLDVMVRTVTGLDHKFIQVTEALLDIVMQCRGSGTRNVLFNITGGYKGAVPSMTALAIDKDWELYYQHESCEFAVEWKFEVEGHGPSRKIQVKEREAKPWRV